MHFEIAKVVQSTQRVVALIVLISGCCGRIDSARADDFSAALERLRSADAGEGSQTDLQQAWQTVAGADETQLTIILAAMQDVSPLAENWLRAAVDAIAERQLRISRRLPGDELQQFLLDSQQSPRARRTAFEWLTRVDPATPNRMLPEMLEDSSLEIRHDAVARLLSEAEEASNEEVKREKYRRALRAARGLSQTKKCIKALAELGESPDLNRHFGYITQWKVIGPFDNEAGKGFDAVYPPEMELDFTKQYEGKSGTVQWLDYSTSGEDQGPDEVGIVDLNEALVEEKGVAGYLAAIFHSPIDQELQCRYGTVNATKLWINGKLLISKNVYHMGGEFDQYIATTKFHQGKNTILLKVCQNELTESWARPWEVRLRITDLLGGGVNSEPSAE